VLYWISFCGEHFLGVAIVQAGSLAGAVKEATRRKINPGGEAVVFEIPPRYRQQHWPYRNRLIKREELEPIFGPMVTGAEVTNRAIEAAGPERSAIVCQQCNEVHCRCGP